MQEEALIPVEPSQRTSWVRSVGSQLAVPYRWLCCSEGSTRQLALMRIGIVLNVWARWSDDRVLYRDIAPEALLVGSLFFLSSTMALVGLFTRFSMPVLAAVVSYFVFFLGHERGVEPYTHHHTTLLAWCCIFLALGPSGRSLSVDRYLAVQRSRKRGVEPPPERANLYAVRLLALQLVAVYLWGALDKTNLGFLSGARMTHYLMAYYTGPREVEQLFAGATWILGGTASATVALEYGLALGLFFRSTRRLLIVPGLLLHGAFYFALSVFTFSTTMAVLYLAFIDDDELDAVVAALLPIRSAGSATSG